MPNHDVQIIMDGKSVILKLDDANIKTLQGQLTANYRFVTVEDVDGEMHAFQSNCITAVTSPKNHDLCDKSSDKLIQLFDRGALTEEELRAHFGYGQKLVNSNQFGINFSNTLLSTMPMSHPWPSVPPTPPPYTISGTLP